MTPQQSVSLAASAIDDAVEDLTFDRFDWALEDAWRGVALALGAAAGAPVDLAQLGERGSVPRAGSLLALLPNCVGVRGAGELVAQMEALRADSGGDPSLLADRGDAVARIVFGAADLLAALAARIDVRVPGVPGPPTAFNSGVQLGIPRRTALQWMAAGAVLPVVACARPASEAAPARERASAAAAAAAEAAPASIRAVTAIDSMQWPTSDPFLFCAYHQDDYPQGNDDLGPAASLEGRLVGRDFEGRDNWRMYHGEVVPGFPKHPHRGFETVTVVRTGLLDHADSMGAAARYGGGDVQWLTAGGGIQHAEMFPLLRADRDNPLELFQIWLNLPSRDKMVAPYFTMLWSEQIPKVTVTDDAGRASEVTVAAGTFLGHRPPPPPPNSWASRAEADIAIWSLRLEPHARLELPAVTAGTERSLYVHRGDGAQIGDRDVPNLRRVELAGAGPIAVSAGATEVELLLLQGRPIGEPVARRGPFVMNTQDEIRQAYTDYQRTQFGGWPWPSTGPVHGVEPARFARHVDGRHEEPT